MTRRGLIGALLAGATMDPERLLWRPGAKLISISKPKPIGYVIKTTGMRMRFTHMYDAHGRYSGTRMDLMMGTIALDNTAIVVRG